MGGHADRKIKTRKAVHAAFSYPVKVNGTIDVTARWHTKQALIGELDSGGYSEYVASNEQLVFDTDELLGGAVELAPNDVITIDHPAYAGIVFTLDTMVEADGPTEQKWRVVRRS